MNSYNLVFRVGRIYFDVIKSRNKLQEVRRKGEFWNKRASKALKYIRNKTSVIAVFICGGDVYRCSITRIDESDAEKALSLALNRAPTPEEISMVGGGKVWVFSLGDEIKQNVQSQNNLIDYY